MNPYARRYLLHGLNASPIAAEALLAGLTDAQADRRPDPERFTIREALCHLADWEFVWLERIQRIINEDNPLLPGYDEGQMAIDRNYAGQNLAEQLARFREGRAALAALLQGLSPEQWERAGLRDEIGPVTINDLATLVLGDDGYHLRQFVEFSA